MVKNKCIDYLRAEKTRKNYESLNQDSSSDFNIEDTLEREERLKIMNEYLNKINEKQASALKLRDFEGYSYVEIADVLGETESNIKVLIFRGRNALMKLLKKRNGLQSAAY